MTAPGPAASIQGRLATVPEGVDVSLVIRHAEREEIPEGAFGRDVNLTAKGIRVAEQLGAALLNQSQGGMCICWTAGIGLGISQERLGP